MSLAFSAVLSRQAFSRQARSLEGAFILSVTIAHPGSTSAGAAVLVEARSPELPNVVPGATSSATHAQVLVRLAAKKCLLAGVVADMLEEGRDLARTEIELALAADQPISGNYYLSLVVAGELFAVSALNVCALVEASQFISESSTTSNLRRAIRWRDTLVPVIVLSQHLVERPLESSWSSCVVILELIRDDSRQRVGVMVDAVGKVLEIHPADIEPPVTDDSQACSDVLLGMPLSANTGSACSMSSGGFGKNYVLPCSTAPINRAEHCST
ncbi:chemotaxis protein CheW [Pseudomonas sp. CFBP 5748]